MCGFSIPHSYSWMDRTPFQPLFSQGQNEQNVVHNSTSNGLSWLVSNRDHFGRARNHIHDHQNIAVPTLQGFLQEEAFDIHSNHLPWVLWLWRHCQRCTTSGRGGRFRADGTHLRPCSVSSRRIRLLLTPRIQPTIFHNNFCSLLPLRRKLLCCPSEWVSATIESEPSINEFCRFRSDVPRSLKLPRRRSFTEMLPSYI